MPQQDHLTARLVVDDDFEVAPVNNRLFGSFVEHLGRCVYTGIYEPDHPNADEHGFRKDVIDLVNEGKVDLRGSISHTWNFEDAQAAFDFVDSHDPSYRKGVLTFKK